jgi:5,6,7,8-tetrahydromethanopterin hydro-lyase
MSQLGEAAFGNDANAAHVNTVLGHRNGPVGAAWATALATPSAGHAPFVACLRPNMALQPPTLVVSKATTTEPLHQQLLWGAGQAGVASGVLRAVAEGIIPQGDVDDLVLICALWINPQASDADTVYANNAEATYLALRNGSKGLPAIGDLLAARHEGVNGYYTAPRPK